MQYGGNFTQFNLSRARAILPFWFLNYPKYICTLPQNKLNYTATKFGMGGPISQLKCEFIYNLVQSLGKGDEGWSVPLLSLALSGAVLSVRAQI